MNQYYAYSAARSKKAAAKYGNRKVQYDGMTFDSKLEAKRYAELKLLEKAGMITDLQRQVKFELISRKNGADGKVLRNENGDRIGNAHSYYADFVYWRNGEKVVEDTKGVLTDVYILKRAIMLEKYGIIIKEIRR